MEKIANKRSAGTAPRQKTSFQLKPIAAGGTLLLSAMAGSACAQAATPAATAAAEGAPALVTVSGIRRGIEDAISVKRNAESIVEAISAEDIGKLPDVSIAESLSRLPGIAAQRVAGRAQVLSIRGLAPDFSTTTLNGREQASTGDNRSVEYDQYPSELINGAVVYKTPDASLVGQGLSGTIDLQTVRPLEFPGRTMAFNVRGEKNSLGSLNQGRRDTGYRASGIYIDQFANRTIGVALGYARLDSPGQSQKWGNWGYKPTTYNGAAVLASDGTEVSASSSKQVRDGVMGVLQWKPNRDFSSLVDVYYSKFNQSTTTRGMQFATGIKQGDYSNPVFGSYNGNQVLQSATYNAVNPVLRNDLTSSNDKLFALGWNNKLKVGDKWSAIADLSYSRATRSEMVLETYAGAPAADKIQIARNLQTGLPQLAPGYNYADANLIKLSDPGGWGQDGYVKYPHVSDELKALRLSAKRELDGVFSGIDLGLNYGEREKTRHSTESSLLLKNGARFADVPASLLQRPTSLSFAGLPGMISYDMLAALNQLYVQTQKFHQDIFNKDWTVKEKVSTGYAKLGIDTELGQIGVRGNLGAQLVHTQQASNAFNVDTSDVSHPAAARQGTSYNDFLPSLNLNFDIGNEQNIRFGAGKTMARARLDQLRASSSASVDASKLSWSGNGGNSELKPWRAKALDLSYEKYFGKSGYVSLAGFYKKLSTYIYDQVQTFDYTGYPNNSDVIPKSPIGTMTRPANGDGGVIKGMELAGAIDGKTLTPWLDGFGATGSVSRTSSAIQPDGPGSTSPLPGLSRTVSNLQAYYEQNGYSARVTRAERSDYRGEVTGFGADRAFTDIKGSAQIDLQAGYEIKQGAYKGLSFLVQVINLNNTAYQTTSTVVNASGGASKLPSEYTKYGRTLLLGLNYKM